MEKRLIINMFVGLRGSGMSETLMALLPQLEQQGKTVHVVRTDDWYKEKMPIDYAPNCIINEIEEHRKSVDHVIIDGTNISRRQRAYILAKFRPVAHLIANVFLVSQESIVHNGYEDQLEQLWPTFQVPIYAEGFDNIIYHTDTLDITVDTTQAYLKTLVAGCTFDDFMLGHPYKKLIRGYDQNNKFHTNTLDVHMYNTYKLIIDSDVNDYGKMILGIVAAFHDLGKPFVAEKRDNGFTRFIGHENVSGYLTARLFGRLKLNHLIRDQVVAIIQYHMYVKQAQLSAKKLLRVEKLLGEPTFSLLMKFSEFDTRGK